MLVSNTSRISFFFPFLTESVDVTAAYNLGNVDQPISSLPSAQLCSPCMLALLQGIQQTPYSNYDSRYIPDWVTLQSRCNTGPLPTAVQPPVTNITALPGVTTSDPANLLCLSGNHYIGQPGDDAQKIAVRYSVATGILKILNGIFPDGTNLFSGQDLYVVVLLPHFSEATISDNYSIVIYQRLARRTSSSPGIVVQL